MREKKNCLDCGVVIYYDGLCWKCKEKQKHDDLSLRPIFSRCHGFVKLEQLVEILDIPVADIFRYLANGQVRAVEKIACCVDSGFL